MFQRILPGLLITVIFAAPALGADFTPIFTYQGPNWSAATRADFYSRDQGSRIMPLAWFQALKQADNRPFLADNLSRYGYLPNPTNSHGLPVGFTASGPAGFQSAGMTCAACHTRQITAEGKTYRIDGGPAIVDFQSFLSDLDSAVGRVLMGDAAFLPFATEVLRSATPDPQDVTALRQRVDAWYLRYHTLMARALPSKPWGPARLDAVGMIFNRLTGLDLGPPPSFLISGNIKPAVAPVRYPFLWNAPRQDKTQWPGFADNGNDLLALSRNLGQVLGVFGVFEPKKELFVFNFLNNNSANFDGLSAIEDLIKQIGPPQWPWLVNTNLAAQGKVIYERKTADGGCAECHGEKTGEFRSFSAPTWQTPIQDVGTDTREYDILAWTADPGVLEGAYIPRVTDQPLKKNDFAFNILKTSVAGSIIEHFLTGGGGAPAAAARVAQAQSAAGPTGAATPPPLPLPPALRELQGAFNPPASLVEGVTVDGVRIQNAPTVGAAAAQSPPRGAYESRVMHGIWAAAPYLHNGSVPTLAELLKPPTQRVTKFKIGPAYDTKNIGLAGDQSQFNYTLETGCDDRNSGDSNCGHDFGTQLSDKEKEALLEYLKTL
jgi:mono/diheme cytochrome c family protein